MSRWRLGAAAVALLVVGAAAVLLPALAHATVGTPARSPERCTTSDGADEAGAVATSATAGVVSVVVPPGRLHLEPSRVSVVVPAGTRRVELPEILVADLREGAPGWQLSATMTGGPDAVLVAPGPTRHVAGTPQVRRVGASEAGVGACIVLAEGSGFGSSFLSGAVVVAPHDATTEVELELHLHPVTP